MNIPSVTLLALMTTLMGINLESCSKKGTGSASEAKTKRATAVVERRDLDFAVEVIGDLRPSVQVDVKAEISGRIKTIRIGINQAVKRDDVVVELDDSDLLTEKASTEVEIEGAKLQLKKASLADERARQLAVAELIPKQDADNLRLDAEIAKNSLDKAAKRLQSVEDRLSKTRIVAPISGTVIGLPIVEGQVVIGGPSAAAGTLLMTLANLAEMLISTHVNQVDVTRMKTDQPVEVTVDAFEKMKLEGKIHFIAPVASIKNNIKGFTVDILVSRPDPRIRPGMSANVKAPISRVAGALTLPVEAVFREGDKRVVYLKSGDGFNRREVEVGIVTASHAEIKSGLKEGDKVSLARPKESPAKN
ncbi:MAG: efflux RND transporter periplasmic adaptor subunit [Verrucomicrobia bacterium]|nr:efflux RND transporter periplasmic adaptor subunit [Verrucomicrobiota bacterium]